MDMHDLKFEDERFDLVFARDVFEHAVAPFVVFSEMARVSKKYVLIILPDDTWGKSPLHISIPTLKQMVVLGMKQDMGLCLYDEAYHIAVDIPFKEYYYVFRK
ncbi:MAG TPA: methyltransferase domain-containing protein, partial [candidate division CPR3 bacterium]|nr:methyltransferase domain-containing protein [candidate division CPR3 bacterium]